MQRGPTQHRFVIGSVSNSNRIGDFSIAVKILIADDHEIVLEGIRTLVGRSRRGWEICGEARNGADAVEMVKRLRPDIAVLDITMPVMNGLHAAAQIAGL